TFGFVAEADLDGDLPVDDVSLVEVSTDGRHFKPVEVLQRVGCVLKGVGEGGVGTVGRSADDVGVDIKIIDQDVVLVVAPGRVPFESLVDTTLRCEFLAVSPQVPSPSTQGGG